MQKKPAKRRKNSANSWLLKSTTLVPLAIAPGLLHAQDADTAAAASTTASASMTAEAAEVTETVIVTGTRATGVDTFTSSSPVQVLDAEDCNPPASPIS